MFRSQIFAISFAALLALTAISCKPQAAAVPPVAKPVAALNTNQQIFQVKGVVQEVKPEIKTIVIKHEAVTNYMPAMTMPFEVRDTNELRGLQPGDAVGFQMVVTESEAWIEHLTKLHSPHPGEQPSRLNFQIVRDVDLLKVGDALPEYHFTNELGRAVSTKEFQGQAFAFTFFFTRCPYPTFCPFLSSSFEAAQKKLLAAPNIVTNWHLFSISFDPETDSPATLKAYAEHYDYQPQHWSFVSGDLTEITAIGDQVGEYFGHDETGAITHNLRTVVVDTQGHLQKIFTDNKWTSDDLVAELTKAASVKP